MMSAIHGIHGINGHVVLSETVPQGAVDWAAPSAGPLPGGWSQHWSLANMKYHEIYIGTIKT